MKALFRLAFAGVLALGIGAVWVFGWNQALWAKLLFTALTPVLLLACILAAEFVLIFFGYEGSSGLSGAGHKEAVRGLAGCGLFTVAALACIPWLKQPGTIDSAAGPMTADAAKNWLKENGYGESSGGLLTAKAADARALLQKSVDEWSGKLEKITLVSAKFDEDSSALAAKIMSMGFSSTADIDKSPAHRKIAEEYAELQSQVELLRKRKTGYKAAIEEARSALRRMERQEALETAGVSSSEIQKLAGTVAELDERLESSAKGTEKSRAQVEIWLREALNPGTN